MGRRLGLTVLVALLLIPSAANAGDAGGSPRVHYTANDMSRAKRTVLRLRDLIASFHVDRKGRGVPMIPHCGAYPGDRSNTTVTGEASSSFTDGFNLMGSHVLFFKSQFDLEHYWQRTVRAGFVTCDAYWLRHSAKQGATARTVFARALPLERTGADAAAAYRSVTHLTFVGHPT